MEVEYPFDQLAFDMQAKIQIPKSQIWLDWDHIRARLHKCVKSESEMPTETES